MLLFLPIWVLAVLVTWRRSAKMARAYRIGLVLAITIGIFCLAEGLGLSVTASKLLALDTPQAAHDARYAQVGSWTAYTICVVSLVIFSLLCVRGTVSARRGGKRMGSN